MVEYRGKDLVNQLFCALAQSHGDLLPKDWAERYDEARRDFSSDAQRVVCDYVAGMTDRYAAELHGRVFADGPSVFKPLW